jgi:hypothetical protein
VEHLFFEVAWFEVVSLQSSQTNTLPFKWLDHVKLRCDKRFQREFIACSCVIKEVTLVWANQREYFENATACRKRTLKTTVATQLKQSSSYGSVSSFSSFYFCIDIAARDRVSISSTFFVQLLCARSPKAQKDSQVVSLFMLSGFALAKAVGEIDPEFSAKVENSQKKFSNA